MIDCVRNAHDADKNRPEPHIFDLFGKGTLFAHLLARILTRVFRGDNRRIEHGHLARILRAHQKQTQRDQNQNAGSADQVEAAKQRLTQRNYAHVFLKPVSGCCDLKRNRTSQAHLVSHNARISARRQKRKVIRNVLFGQLYRHFLCKKRTCNQADAPVDPPEHKRGKRKQQNGARILFRETAKLDHAAVDNRRFCKHRARNQAERNLHRKGNQFPKALRPVLHDLDRRGRRKDDGQESDDQRQDDCDHERIRKHLSHPCFKFLSDFNQHLNFPLFLLQ